ncbi:penicillin-binding protein [Pseudofulvibacter geojedonensis]|uniref:Penicillin-binding protein n=1 Tax=Pseudofulvibacter geojedonensis TaxID=1123758 RepID=A0ABW3I110_9FLAO
MYFVAAAFLMFAVAIAVQLFNVQYVDGDNYRKLVEKRTHKEVVIKANRGSIYADDGSLLATSVPKYDIRFDAVTVSKDNFSKELPMLCDSLSVMFGKSRSYYKEKLKKARRTKNRYMLVARNLGYSDYMRVRGFPMFRLGAYKGGLIVEQRTIREHPLGGIARRTVGRPQSQAGIEGAYDLLFLKGEDGSRLKQKIAKGQYKPIHDENEKEPKNGLDVISTIDVNIQDIAHHALLNQLEKFEADHGTVVVMETETGEVKAISNLQRNSKGRYLERMNHAVGESHEPGSTFKLMVMVAALESKVIDSSYVVDTENGVLTYYGKYKVRDSRHGGYGKISAARAFEVSSNTGMVKIVEKGFKDNPEAFVNRLYNMRLNEQLGLEFKGEGVPKIPHPNDKDWSGISLQWMAWGYGVSLTPLQTLTFYNAIANNGEMVKPRLVKEVRDFKQNKPVEKFDKVILNPRICSAETIGKVKEMMKNVVERGTAKNIYSPEFSMAGKTGTCRTDYGNKKADKNYVASFAGYFPADKPKYSCIVVIHKPNTSIGYYGNVVAAPVFKTIAKKIYTDTPMVDEVNVKVKPSDKLEKVYAVYNKKSQKEYKKIPNVVGMSGMDALAFLENLGLRVKLKGNGKVVKQSLKKGIVFKDNQEIVLELS